MTELTRIYELLLLKNKENYTDTELLILFILSLPNKKGKTESLTTNEINNRIKNAHSTTSKCIHKLIDKKFVEEEEKNLRQKSRIYKITINGQKEFIRLLNINTQTT